MSDRAPCPFCGGRFPGHGCCPASQFMTQRDAALAEVERLRAALVSAESTASGLDHSEGCITQSTGHDPHCDCGVYGLVFGIRSALNPR